MRRGQGGGHHRGQNIWIIYYLNRGWYCRATCIKTLKQLSAEWEDFPSDSWNLSVSWHYLCFIRIWSTRKLLNATDSLKLLVCATNLCVRLVLACLSICEFPLNLPVQWNTPQYNGYYSSPITKRFNLIFWLIFAFYPRLQSLVQLIPWGKNILWTLNFS